MATPKRVFHSGFTTATSPMPGTRSMQTVSAKGGGNPYIRIVQASRKMTAEGMRKPK